MRTVYDDRQDCTATAALLESALAGCMLVSMGAIAKRGGIDLTDAAIDVELVGTPSPKIGYTAVNAVIRMPPGIDPTDREKLERASDACPIKHSLDPAIRVSVNFEYPEERR